MQVAFIGDSLTLGVNDPTRLGWTARVCKKIDPSGEKITAYNLGVRASTSAHIASRWQFEVENRIKANPKNTLIFCFGAADYVNGLSIEDSICNAEKILSQASKHYKTLYISPPPMVENNRDKNVSKLSEKIIKICNHLDIKHLNLNSTLRKNPAYFKEIDKRDGVHPGTAGYKIMADIIFHFLYPFILPDLD